MYKYNKKTIKSFLDIDDVEFSKKTVIGLLRSLLEPIANQNAQSFILTRLKNTGDIDGILKRLEYCSNVEMYSFLDREIVVNDNLVELEFVIITSHRYNAVLIWDYSQSSDKNSTKIYLRANSKDVNDVFEIAKEQLKVNFDEKFYSFRPERRENTILNMAILNVLKILNENIVENEFNSKEQEVFANKLQTQNEVDKINANIRHGCHEIRNQLSILDIYSQILEKQLGKNSSIDLIKKSISQIRLQLDELRSSDNLNLEEKNLKDIILSSIDVFEQILKERNNTIEFVDKTKDGAMVFVDEDRFFAILNNVVKNADESTSDDKIEISLEKDEKYAKIFIKNHGEKIPEELCENLFKDGFTTKKEGWGVGLGVCRKYLAMQLGSISLVKSNDNETEFLIKIPLSACGIV